MGSSRYRGCMSSLFLMSLATVAIALSIYNAWQVSVLKTQVLALQIKVAQLKAVKQTAGTQSTDFALVEEARKHIEQATKLISNGNLKTAKVELQKSLQKLDRLPRFTEKPSWTMLEDLRKKLDQTSSALEKIWSNQSRPPANNSKGGRTK